MSPAQDDDDRLSNRPYAAQVDVVRYRDLIEQTSDLVQMVDSDGSFLFTNPSWRRTLGYSRDEVDRLSFRDVVAPEHLLSCEAVFAQLMQGVAARQLETTFVSKSGKHISVEGTINALKKDGAQFSTQGLFRDITARKRAERELLRSVQAKDHFLASMSHELKTPLNAILGLSEALQERLYGPLTEKQCESLATIENSGRELLEMVNGVLDLARIGSNDLTLEIRPLDPDELCQNVLRLVRPKAASRGLVIAYANHGDVDVIWGDARRLKQSLLGLLDNAIKFTPSDGRLGLEVQAAEDGRAGLVVWDTGVGIDADSMQFVKGNFSQASGGYSRTHDGIGLGLSLAMALATLHGGTLEIESNLSEGSRVTILLPTAGPTGGSAT